MSTKGKILAVDDTPASLKLLTELLEAEGYEVRSAISGEMALHSAVLDPPELILLDVRMPGMDGFEVCRRLKAQAETRDVPVIFVSALSETQDKVEGLELGAVDFVSKPYQREELLMRVRTHLEIVRLRSGLELLVEERTKALKASLAEVAGKEKALRESESSFRALFEHAPIPFILRDEHLHIIMLNEAFIRTLGYQLEEISTPAQWFTKAYPDPTYRQQVLDRLKAAMEKNGREGALYEQEELTLRCKDGSSKVMLASAMFTTELGAPKQLISLVDITERKQTENLLRQHKVALETTHDGFWLVDAQGVLLDANQAYANMSGYSIGELRGMHISQLEASEKADDVRAHIAKIASLGWAQFETCHRHKDGHEIDIEVSASIIDETKVMVVFCRDISNRKKDEATLRKLSLAVEQSPNSIVIANIEGKVEYVNASFTRITGYRPDEVLGQNPRMFSAGKTPKSIYEEMWATILLGDNWEGELLNRRKDGSEYIELEKISPVRQADGKITHYLAVKEDLTEKKAVLERIDRLAHFDQLTGLPNQTLLNDRFKYALSLAQRSGENLAVLFLDLDRFKNINDTLGHSVGDSLLMETGRRIREALREEDIVSRKGGDEFVVVLPSINGDGAALVASKLLEIISRPFRVEQQELISTASIGIAVYPDDGDSLESLSKNADAAMYQVKQDMRNGFRFFTQEMQSLSIRALQISNALRHALARNELYLHYQPQFSIDDGHVIGAEALLRWKHPELGMISPAEFIPIAEDMGMIIQIGEWVLRTATMQMKAWLDSGLPPMVMAVNLSAVQFRQTDIAERITLIVDEAKLPHEHLEVELTEAVTMDDPQSAINVMNSLHERGIRMSIDDFGTGYSSLSYLKKFKVYKLKIDQSFVRDLNEDPEDRAIVSTIINLASSLGLRTIAEGVETASQLAFLRLHGCNEVQGYFFSKPLPADQFEAFVKNSKAALPAVLGL